MNCCTLISSSHITVVIPGVFSGLREERVEFSNADRPLLCNLASEKLKRFRDDEMVVTTPFKRIR